VCCPQVGAAQVLYSKELSPCICLLVAGVGWGALDGAWVPSEAGGDLLRDGPGVLPTGGCDGCNVRTCMLMHMLAGCCGWVKGAAQRVGATGSRRRAADRWRWRTAHRWVQWVRCEDRCVDAYACWLLCLGGGGRLRGARVPPEAGGDLLRDGPGVLPTGGCGRSCGCRWNASNRGTTASSTKSMMITMLSNTLRSVCSGSLLQICRSSRCNMFMLHSSAVLNNTIAPRNCRPIFVLQAAAPRAGP
jgi:hypothetical protein